MYDTRNTVTTEAIAALTVDLRDVRLQTTALAESHLHMENRLLSLETTIQQQAEEMRCNMTKLLQMYETLLNKEDNTPNHSRRTESSSTLHPLLPTPAGPAAFRGATIQHQTEEPRCSMNKIVMMYKALMNKEETRSPHPKQSEPSATLPVLLPTPAGSSFIRGPLQHHEVRENSIINSTDSTQTIMDEFTSIEVTLKPIQHNLLSSLLPSKKIPAEKENLVSKSQLVALSCVENLCTEAVRQNVYESLSSILPPEKPPDEFVTSMDEKVKQLCEFLQNSTKGRDVIEKICKYHCLLEMKSKVRRWCDEQHVFEAEGNVKTTEPVEKLFGNFPYPYMNGYLQRGHAFSVSKLEFATTYQKLREVNVIFPFGFHCTNMTIMRSYGLSDTEIAEFRDPKKWLAFFLPLVVEDFKAFGLGVDWRLLSLPLMLRSRIWGLFSVNWLRLTASFSVWNWFWPMWRQVISVL